MRRRQDLFGFHELVVEFCLVGDRTQATTHEQAKATLFGAVVLTDRSLEPEIMHGGQPAGVLSAPTEGRLEFAAEILAVGMAEQKF